MHGQHRDQVVVILPDGQLGIPNGLVPTEEPFRVASVEAMKEDLIQGPFAGFEAYQSTHYLVLSQGSPGFAEDSVKLLEDLYKGLADSLRKRGIPIHDLEFPLVAVIFDTEADFRAFKPVDPDVQAYYEIFTNRIYFYEHSDRDEHSPEVAALRKPQTVAHEGRTRSSRTSASSPAWPPGPPGSSRGWPSIAPPPRRPGRGRAGGDRGRSTRSTWRRSATCTTPSRPRSGGGTAKRSAATLGCPWSNTS